MICSLIGILIILFIAENTEIPNSNIANITKEKLGEKTTIRGIIKKVIETPGLLIINVQDTTGNITAIIFKEENITLEKNQIVTIEGTIIEYKGNLEIQTDVLKLRKPI